MKINLKFYTVKMPSGRKYYVSGKSKKQIADDYGIGIKDVSIGADTLHLPHITEYNKAIGIDAMIRKLNRF